jgi:hypothetical protein
VSTYWAFYWKLTYGGYPFGDKLLAKGTGTRVGRGRTRADKQRMKAEVITETSVDDDEVNTPGKEFPFLRHQSSSLPAALGDLPADEFRRVLHQVADWIADYRATIETRRVAPEHQPGATMKELPTAPPDVAEPIDEILRDLDRLVLPNLVHWGHPAFLGYFATTTTAPGIIGEMLAAALNVSAMTWQTSPAATELEVVVLDWIRQMLGLPAEFHGIVYDTASVAVLHALAAAREELGFDIRRDGLAGRASIPTLTLYASDQAHSSLEKAAITLGIGEANVRRIKSDELYRMDVGELRQVIEQICEQGGVRSPSLRPSARLRRRALTRLKKSLLFAESTESGST